MVTNNPRVLVKLLKIKNYLSSLEQITYDTDFQHILNITQDLYDYYYLKAMQPRSMGERAQLKQLKLKTMCPKARVSEVIRLLERRKNTPNKKDFAAVTILLEAFNDHST